jgi:hypothetical protein
VARAFGTLKRVDAAFAPGKLSYYKPDSAAANASAEADPFALQAERADALVSVA